MNKKTKGMVVTIVILAAVLGVMLYGFVKYKEYKKGYDEEYAGTETVEGVDVEVTIPSGASTKEIAQILKDAGLIQYPSAFVNRVKESEYRGNLQMGTYTLNTGMSTWDMIQILGKAPESRNVLATVTIPEGFTVEMIAARLENNGVCTADEFLAATQEEYDYEFLQSIPEGVAVNYRLQGFLFPATYDIYEDTIPHDIVAMMLDKFDSVYESSLREQATTMNYSAYELITRASIVEREAKLEAERPIIADVINNRLAIDMMLQMCPTVLYPLTNGMYDKGEVTYDDLEIDSPYNTYKNTGLPIGPICNPGNSSIRAVLYPDDNNYLYYHVDDEEAGTHIFTETYQEHVETQN